MKRNKIRAGKMAEQAFRTREAFLKLRPREVKPGTCQACSHWRETGGVGTCTKHNESRYYWQSCDHHNPRASVPSDVEQVPDYHERPEGFTGREED